MIIAFYPGGGGNRYLQMLLGNEWSVPKKSYDRVNTNQKYAHRYLLDSVPAAVQEHTLTHCMNSRKIIENIQCQNIVYIHTNLQQSLRREWMLHGHERFMKKNSKDTVNRIDHYRAFKDKSWPNVDTIEQLENLPEIILNETKKDYMKIVNPTHTVMSSLSQLTQNYIDRINSAYEMIVWHRDYYQNFPVDFGSNLKIVNVEKDHDEFSIFMRHELSLYQSEVFDSVWDTIYHE
jgi:hypothetical protein